METVSALAGCMEAELETKHLSDIPLHENSRSAPPLLRRLSEWLNDGKSCAGFIVRIDGEKDKGTKVLFPVLPQPT